MRPVDTYLELAKSVKPDLPISTPPCKDCRFFHPQAIYMPLNKDSAQELNGVRLCWAEEMFPDFSCYQDGVKET